MAGLEMGRRFEGAVELVETEDLERLADLSQTLVGFLDPAALSQRTALDLYRMLGLPLVSVAVREGATNFAMRGVHGARTTRFREVKVSTGKGLGGRVMVERRPVEVTATSTTPASPTTSPTWSAPRGSAGWWRCPSSTKTSWWACCTAGCAPSARSATGPSWSSSGPRRTWRR